MSLHLGNLSSRIHKNELERVFRRFGRCAIQLKDKFGFVIYDFPANAERALKVLHGKKICGEPITLSWSNRQPRLMQRLGRGGRPYAFKRGGYFMREDYAGSRLVANGQQAHRMGFEQINGYAGGPSSTDLFDEAAIYNHNRYDDYRDDFAVEAGGTEQIFLGNDRWGGQLEYPYNENGVEGELKFDRYEPTHDDDRRVEEESHLLTQSSGSPIMKKPQEKATGEGVLNNADDSKGRQTCYGCGKLGHKMRDCPRKTFPQRKKSRKFGHRHSDETSSGVNDGRRLPSRSQRKLQSSRDVSRRQHKGDKKSSHSRKHGKLITDDDKDHNEKKRSGWDDRSPERHRLKKAKLPTSPPYDSVSLSRSSSTSSKSLSGSSSQSRRRSLSCDSRSLSPISNSAPKSHDSRLVESKSPSRSRSSSPRALSLSVSLERSLPLSPNKVQRNQKEFTTFTELEQVGVERNLNLQDDEESDKSRQEKVMHGEENNIFIVPASVEEDGNKSAFQKDDNNEHDISRRACEVKNLSLDKSDSITKISCPQGSREMKEFEKGSNDVSNENMSGPGENTESELTARPSSGNIMSISTEEMLKAMKHYGLEHPNQNVEDLSMETYFGSARLWPWEIIYYRRVRKGCVSTENYARRIAQNEEFGIVDTYIRSSSGWYELCGTNA